MNIPLGSMVSEDDAPHLGGFIHGGDPNTYCPSVWRRIIYDHGIKSVVDVGCGEGASVGWFVDSGIDALGIDGSEAALALARPGLSLVLHDYSCGPYRLTQPRDLCWCSEFVEHVEEQFIPSFLTTFQGCRYLALTHAFPGQEGWHHVNCQPSGYWVRLVERVMSGFVVDMEYSHTLRSLTEAEHVRRSLLFFRSVS